MGDSEESRRQGSTGKRVHGEMEGWVTGRKEQMKEERRRGGDGENGDSVEGIGKGSIGRERGDGEMDNGVEG